MLLQLPARRRNPLWLPLGHPVPGPEVPAVQAGDHLAAEDLV